MIVSAPALMFTAGPGHLMMAPLPLEMVMPTSLIEIIAPVVVLSRMPPVGPGMSLIMIVILQPGLQNDARARRIAAERERGHLRRASPESSRSRSDSPDRLARTRSTRRRRSAAAPNTPICLPVTGKHGIAQVDGIRPETSGTIAMMRPICIGSMLLITVPRYLPKNHFVRRS